MNDVNRACPICECQEKVVMTRQDFILPESHPLNNGYNLVCCNNCHFVYVDTTAKLNDYDTFYREFSKYEDGANISGAGHNLFDNARLKGTSEYLVKMLGIKKKFLDVGCAKGGLLRELQKVGVENLFGYDPSAYCANYVNKHFGIETKIGSIFEMKLKFREDEKYDVLILSHVLEHLLDIDGAITNICFVMGNSSFLYIEVPDATKYSEYFVNPYHFFDTEHINHFSLHYLKLLASEFSFEVIDEGEKEISLSDTTVYPAIYVLLQKKTGFTEQQVTMAKDNNLKDAINAYITKSKESLNLSLINMIANDGKDYIFWGVGNTTLRLLAATDLKRANIKCFTDNNPKTYATSILGKKVVPPADLVGSTEPIIVFTKIYKNEILKQIKELGLKNEVISIH